MRFIILVKATAESEAETNFPEGQALERLREMGSSRLREMGIG